MLGNVSSLRTQELSLACMTAVGLGVVAIAFINRKKLSLGPDGKPLPLKEGYLPFIGHLLDISRNTDRLYDFLTEDAEKLGGKPYVQYVPGKDPVVITSCPEHLNDILLKFADKFIRGAGLSNLLLDFLGRGILNSEGDEWYFQRKTASHLFSTSRLNDVIHEIIREKSNGLVKALDSYSSTDKEFSASQLMTALTCDVFTKLSFGIELNCLEENMEGRTHDFIQHFTTVSEITRSRSLSPVFIWKLKRMLGIGSEKTLAESRRKLHSFVTSVIDETVRHRQRALQEGDVSSQRPSDLVSMFLDSKVKSLSTGEKINIDAEMLRDMTLNFIFAGKDTTSVSLSWLIVNLNRHPETAKKIRAELREKLPKLFQQGASAPTTEEVSSLTYLEACILENLRLYPSVALDGKYALEDTTLSDGTFIPAGYGVGLMFYATGRLTSIWGHDAAEFKPERWIDANGALKQVSPSKFPAFALGKHACLGKKFAYMEMKIALATMLSRYDLQLKEDPWSITYGVAITLIVKGDLMCTAVPLKE